MEKRSLSKLQDPVWLGLGFSLKSALTILTDSPCCSHTSFLASLWTRQPPLWLERKATSVVVFLPKMFFQEIDSWCALWLHSVLLSYHLIRGLPWAPYSKRHSQLICSLALHYFFFQNTALHIILNDFLLSVSPHDIINSKMAETLCFLLCCTLSIWNSTRFIEDNQYMLHKRMKSTFQISALTLTETLYAKSLVGTLDKNML